jgi:hypothetical protein
LLPLTDAEFIPLFEPLAHDGIVAVG